MKLRNTGTQRPQLLDAQSRQETGTQPRGHNTHASTLQRSPRVSLAVLNFNLAGVVVHMFFVVHTLFCLFVCVDFIVTMLAPLTAWDSCCELSACVTPCYVAVVKRMCVSRDCLSQCRFAGTVPVRLVLLLLLLLRCCSCAPRTCGWQCARGPLHLLSPVVSPTPKKTRTLHAMTKMYKCLGAH